MRGVSTLSGRAGQPSSVRKRIDILRDRKTEREADVETIPLLIAALLP